MHRITKKIYAYLLPIYGMAGIMPGKIREFENGTFYFFGTVEEYKDAMDRCKYLD